MALAEDMQEIYQNLQIVVTKLKLNDLQCSLACDLKLINAILGILSHSGKYACAYCDGEMSLQSGELRTFGSLKLWYQKFKEAGLDMTKMQHFKNQINESLLTGAEDTTILSFLPPPELHLLMGLVNWVLELLYKVVSKEELHERMRKKGISIRGYQGGGLDGGNSHLFLKHLQYISEETPSQAQPLFDVLGKFMIVVQSCFSLELSTNFKEDFKDFTNSVENLIKYSNETLKIPLKPTWKVHILVTHVVTFLEEKKVGLGIYCEQTSEAAHSVMKPTIARFKRKADHELHGPRMLRAASAFSSQNI